MAVATRLITKNVYLQCKKIFNTSCLTLGRSFSQCTTVYNTRKFSERHEWLVVEGSTGTVGVSQFAQTALGDVVYVELPEIGRSLQKDEEAGVVESVKAANEYYSPVAGTVTEVNQALEDKPGSINEDCYGKGWIYKMKIADPKEVDTLMEEDAYLNYVKDIHS
ncbi:glycine cleavage system H protein-like [Uloborus diversus]|uniref:glycine cleavage system H protein-like n=1 Tax=Uloborus diversus TaxID=327109 RepID=UPI00240A26E7|nr:glycine cleavage system H protein-like [Uloborus diversus]